MTMRHTWAALCALAMLAHPAWARGETRPDHDISLATEDAAVVGDVRSISLTVTPRPGFTISPDGPVTIALKVAPKRGLSLPRRTYQRRDAVDERAAAPRFELRYKATTAGQYTMTVSLQFWLCQRRTCRSVRASRQVRITVREPDSG